MSGAASEKDWQDFWQRWEGVKRKLEQWEAMPAKDADQFATKETRLEELRSDLARLEAEYHETLRRAQERFTLTELAIRWNMTVADILRYTDSGELTAEVRPDVQYTLHNLPLNQSREVSGRILLVSREECDRFEMTHGIKVQQRSFTRGTLEAAAYALANQQGWHDGQRDTLLEQMMESAKEGSLIVRHPHTDLPYRPDPVRMFYEYVTAEDLNIWLASQGADYRLQTRKKVLAADAEGDEQCMTDDRHAGTKKLKMDKQLEAISKVIALKKFDPMAIPDGEKETIEGICTKSEDYKYLFVAKNAFKNAWSKGVLDGLWRIQSHDSYSRRGNW